MSNSQIKVKITVDSVKKTIEKSKFQERWEEHCDENDMVGDGGEGTYPDMTDEFALQCVNDDLESGEMDLSEEFESVSAEATLVE